MLKLNFFDHFRKDWTEIILSATAAFAFEGVFEDYY
jgi:hypothetical protein